MNDADFLRECATFEYDQSNDEAAARLRRIAVALMTAQEEVEQFHLRPAQLPRTTDHRTHLRGTVVSTTPEKRFGWVDKTQWATIGPWPAPLTESGRYEVIAWSITKKEATLALRQMVPEATRRRNYHIVTRADLEQM